MNFKGSRNPFFGKKHSLATRKKMSLAAKGRPSPRKGKKHTLAARQKISSAVKKAYKETDLRERLSDAHWGKKLPEITRERMSAAQKIRFQTGSHPWRGKSHTQESKQKIAAASLRNYQKEETRKKILEAVQKRYRTHPSIEEVLLKKALQKHKVSCTSQVIIETRYVVDILIHPCLIVECDNHNHQTPSGRKKDARRDRVLRRLGYSVLHFSYKKIQDNPSKIAEQICRRLP